MFFLTIANSLGSDQVFSWKPSDIDFVELGISLSALDGYDGADRAHVVAPVGEDVLVVDFFRPGRVTVTDWRR